MEINLRKQNDFPISGIKDDSKAKRNSMSLKLIIDQFCVIFLNNVYLPCSQVFLRLTDINVAGP